jgi:hypothetical protein
MTWARLDDAILDNPKIIRVGPLGFALHVAAITWCSRNLTDGFVPEAKAKQLLSTSWSEASEDEESEAFWELASTSGSVGRDGRETISSTIRMLVQAELWHEEEDERGNFGYRLHDFGDFNPKRSEVLAKRAVKQAAGKQGGKQSGSARKAKAKQRRSKPPSEVEANDNQKRTPDPDPVPPLDLPTTTTQDLTGQSAGRGDIPCPRDLRLTADQRGTLETSMIPGWAIDVLTARFVSSNQVGSEPRPLNAWLKCLSQAVSGDWHNPKRRPSKPEAEEQTEIRQKVTMGTDDIDAALNPRAGQA